MTAESTQSRQSIADRLAGRRLLVTGATGLLAKAFVEKLLRGAPRIGAVYLLVRRRADGTSSMQRLQSEIIGSPVFDRLRARLGSRFEALCAEKLKVVSGDLFRDDLGLSTADRRMIIEQIDGVVNSAATVTFDERLDHALALNALGPARLLELASDCGASFMQVSTCYVSGRRNGSIPEQLHETDTVDVDAVLEHMRETCRRIDEQHRSDEEERRRRLIAAGMDIANQHGWNDTYTFTKWLGEKRIDRVRVDVPTVILRPAIIEGSYEEPVPGWIDGLRMADPMIIAYGRGKLEEFPADPTVPIDIIPVDFVANAMVGALPEQGPVGSLKIYQVCSSSRNPLRVSELADYLEQGFRLRPMTDDRGEVIRVGPFRLVRRDTFVRKWQRKQHRAQQLKSILEQIGLFPEKRRRLAALISQIEQIIYFARIYSPYTHLDGRFCDDNLQRLFDTLPATDRDLFPFDVRQIDWADYVVNRHIPGLRRFVVGGAREVSGSTGAARRRPLDDVQIHGVREQGQSIFEVFEAVARLCGDKPALQMKRDNRWVSYSYQEALAATGAIARRLAEHGLHPGDRVVICSENCPEWALTYLAAMRAGLTAVPLDPQLPPEEIMACARFTDARLICTGRSVTAALSKLTNGPDRVEMSTPFVPQPGATRDEGLPAEPVSSDQVASILFTSGTTVEPKAVPLTHANFLANAHALLRVHPLKSRERFVSVLPMYHAFEFTGGLLVPMIIGATVTYVAELKGPQVIAAMKDSGCTMMLVVPRLLKLFNEAIMRKVRESGVLSRAAFRTMGTLSDLSRTQLGKSLFARVHREFGGHLLRFISGGSALDPELHQFFARMGFTVCEGYGLTETGPVLTVNPPSGGKAGSVGQALPGVELQIRNVNNEGVGELWARGANVMQGYLNNPAATAEVMRDGWFRTGDLCRRDSDGYYYITGRVKDMVVTEAGKNVYPDEVEARYKDLPYVAEICVLGMPSETGVGEAVHAVVVPDFSRNPSVDPSTVERTIREAASTIGQNVPDYQRIQTMHFWSRDLPKTSTLKAKRNVIRTMLLNGEQHVTRVDTSDHRNKQVSLSATDQQLSAGQKFVRKLLSSLTGEPAQRIHADSNLLLDLGMDSLMKLQLIAEIEAHFDLTLSSESASALARVGDIYKLVGQRPVLSGRKQGRRSWRDRAVSQDEALAPGGEVGLAAMPLRMAVRGSLALLLSTYIRVRSSGLENIPSQGPFILAANHTSHLDAPSVITAVGGRRRIWAAGAQDYFFDSALKGWVFSRMLDTIPFDRHSEGFDGLRRCLEKLEQGDGVLFFPEGTRSVTGRMADFKIGAALMAVDSGAVVIPTLIENAYRLFPKGGRFARPGTIHVKFGEPVSPTPWTALDDIQQQYQFYREMTCELQERVRALGLYE